MSDAYLRIVAALEARGTVKGAGQGRVVAQCPAHDDDNPSLSVRSAEGAALIFCHRGCNYRDVMAAMEMTPADLYDEKRAEYVYDSGRVVHRGYDHAGKKRFRQSGDLRKVELYRLAQLRQATDGAVFLVEGEKDVHAIEAAGGVATTAPMGAANVGKCDLSPLHGRNVIAIADRDLPGLTWAQTVRDLLDGKAASLRFGQAKDGNDPADHIAAGHGLTDWEPLALDPPAVVVERVAPVELDEFLGQPDPEYDWLIPGLVERGDRVILTGPEGYGKSTLLRQVGVQAAAGVHPFNVTTLVAPLRVLILDLENSARHTRRELRLLRLAAGDRYRPEPGLLVRCRPEGIDLLDVDDGAWLLDLAATAQPDLIITGPIYKLANGDPTEERTAKVASVWLDRVRTQVGCALVIEAHVPYAAGGKKRPERPYGASLWSRWPEFGLYLSEEGHLRHWRGQRDEREWPAALQRGGEWPWTPVTRPEDLRWARTVELCRDAGDQLSTRDLAGLLGVGVATVHRMVAKHRAEWDALAYRQVMGGGTP